VASVLFPFHALCATFRQRTARVARRSRSRQRQHDVTRSASRANVTPLPVVVGHVLPMRRLPAATSAPSRRHQPRVSFRPSIATTPTQPKTIRQMCLYPIIILYVYILNPNLHPPPTP